MHDNHNIFQRTLTFLELQTHWISRHESMAESAMRRNIPMEAYVTISFPLYIKTMPFI